MVKDADVNTVICYDTNFGYVKAVDKEVNLQNIIVTNIVDLVSPIKRFIGFMFDKVPKGVVSKEGHVKMFKELLKYPPEPPQIEIDPYKDLAYIMYTGGTTGFPKGVPGSHMTEVSYINDIHERFKGYIKEGGDSVIMINPLFHIMAKGFCIATGLNLGNRIVLMPSPNIDAVLKEIERYNVRWMLGVPTLFRMILENDRLAQYNLSSLKYCFCGGDVLPDEIFNRWKALTNEPIYQVYGSTEIGHLTYSPLDKEPSPKTVGTVLESRKIKIADPETLKEVGKGEIGELLVSSPYILNKYWNKPEETKYSFIKIGDEIYYRMGDYVKLSSDNEIQFVERTADIIKYKAYRVSASEVEAALQDHPAVTGACVIGVPDDKVGERIKAIVVLKEDAKGVDGNELIAWCKSKLAPYKVPKYIEFRDMLPKSKVGKLLRKEVREEEKRKAETV
jgi:long-chain acyl-CoA synthetase